MKGTRIRGGYQKKIMAHDEVDLSLGDGQQQDHSDFTFFGAAQRLDDVFKWKRVLHIPCSLA